MDRDTWSCSICKSTQYKKSKKYPATSELFQNRKLLQCFVCGTKSIYPMVDEKKLDEYNKDYWSKVQSDAEISRARYKILAESRAIYLKDAFDELDNFRILDVGAGHGFIIDMIKKFSPNVKASAVEIDTDMHKILEKKCEQVYTIWHELKEQKFDLIILSHVLEHMSDPVKILGELKRNLKKGGYFFIEVPNNDDLHKISLETHLFVYNEQAIKRLIQEVKMKTIDITILGQKIRKLQLPLTYRILERITPKKLFQKYRVLRNRIIARRRRNKSLPEILALDKSGKNRRWIRVIIQK